MKMLEAKFVGTLAGQVALVTGGSRGIGKGIASMLGQAGATVYITGRTLNAAEGSKGSLSSTAEQIRLEGGKCIPVQCDHGNDEDVKRLFDRISAEQDGRLDILVNNAFAGVKFMRQNMGTPFYNMPIEGWDILTTVGVRSNFVCAHHAAQLMIPRKRGLIVNISSFGGLRYLFNTVYGVGKEANDRMAVDMGIELKKHNVTVISLWPGPVLTEEIDEMLKDPTMNDPERKLLFKDAEDVTFSGKAIVALAADKELIRKTARIHIVADLGYEYGFKDIQGNAPPSFRQVKRIATRYAPGIAWMIPSFLHIPKWMLHLLGQKF